MDKRMLDYWIMALEAYKLYHHLFGSAALHDFQTYHVFEMLSSNRGRLEGLTGEDLAKRVTEYIGESKKNPASPSKSKRAGRCKSNS
ncbi:MAG: hypothetical protein IK005_09540 [Paludibacteraceae bacterium]|nr:hypothetical protein [Paludibacteraceae bacterium]MBR4840704.1 hypothetical protein [Paludibacteraceae bacterium]